MKDSDERVVSLLGQAKLLAKEYRALTGRPLGITGEIAEYEASRVLGLELSPVRQPGYDAIREINGSRQRLQIKGRCLLDGCKPGQRLGGIRLDTEWDAVLMVLMNGDYEALEIYEADRQAIEAALLVPGSKARNDRGALALSKFKSIGRRIWSKDIGSIAARPSTSPPASAPRGQGRESGAAGDEFGRRTGRKIAQAIGANPTGTQSNEALWKGKRIVIKCARVATASIGVTYRMLEHIDGVVAALQRPDGRFDVFELSAADYKRSMAPSRSSPQAARKVGIVSVSTIRSLGKPLATALLG